AIRFEALVIDAVVDHAHTLRRVAEAIGEVVSNVLADGDHELARRHRTAVYVPPVAQLRPGEELRERLVLEVGDRGRRRHADAREHHRQREVERLRLLLRKRAAETPVPDGCPCEAEDPRESAAPRRELGNDDRTQFTARLRGDLRDVDPVVQRSVLGQGADEPRGVRLGAADRGRVEREQRDPDHANASASSSRSRAGEGSRTTCSRPRRRISPSVVGSASRLRTVVANSSGVKPASTTPPPESRTSASGPPEGVVTTGSPAAIASAAAIPNPSW